MAGTLVIHPGALGDVLLAVPALRALRREASALALAAQSHIGALLVDLEEVDATVRVDALGLHALFAEDAPPTSVAALAGADRIVSWFGSGDARFASRLRETARAVIVAPSVAPDRPVWEHLLASVAAEPAADLRAPLTVPPGRLADARRALGEAGASGDAPLLVVHPGASGASKRWPVEAFAEVLTRLAARAAVQIVVHEGPTDGEPARALLSALASSRRGRVVHLDNPALPVLAGALAQADAYLGNDSGISHLAAALGVRSVILFKEAMRRWMPWSGDATCVVVDAAPTPPEAVAAVSRGVAGALAAASTSAR